MEGLVGGELPIMHFVLAVDSDVKPSGWWEVTAVPQAENDGSHEQGCFYRFQRIIEEQTNETAAAGGEGATAALTLGQVTYFETYQYVAGAFTAEPEHFFDAMLVRTNERKPNHLFSFSINALTFPSRRLQYCKESNGQILEFDRPSESSGTGRGQRRSAHNNRVFAVTVLRFCH
jgi:hypothetical protein